MSHICVNDEYRSQVGVTDRLPFLTLVSPLSRLFELVYVFSFHLQIFHWFIAPPLHTYFQGHIP
jgi:hypothetical protein